MSYSSSANTGPGNKYSSNQSPPDSIFITFQNPMQTNKTISVTLGEEVDITINLFNILGVHQATLMEGNHLKGSYRIFLDWCELPPGVYFIVATTNSARTIKKIVIL
jgi:hypothetical protein